MPAARPSNRDTGSADPVTPRRYVFLLLPRFSAFDLMTALETLKDANRHDGMVFYEWLLISESGSAVPATNGMEIPVDSSFVELNRQDTLVVLSGDDFEQHTSPKVLGWLRRQARHGLVMGGISSGVYPLLKAGVFKSNLLSTHWTYRTGFHELFPESQVTRAIFQLDDKRFSCAGGVATLDLFLQLIARDNGPDLATWVADNLVCSVPRTSAHEQTISQCSRVGKRNAKVSEAIDIMSETLEAPISPAQIADEIGISTRQLERLFARYLNATPKSYYVKLRLEHARRLLLQTSMKIIDVAVASGFNSPSHFSRLYKKQFEITPYRERGFHEDC